MTSNTFTLTGKSSKLSCNIFPDIVLDESSEYSCALLELTAFHSLPNVSENINNKFYFYQTDTKKAFDGIEDNFRDYLQELQIPTGGYEANEILDYIKREMELKGFRFEYEINKNTIKAKISCSTSIYIGDSFHDNILKKIFGFSQNKIIPKNTQEESNGIVKITNQDVIRVECNISSGSYVNGNQSHSIYEFATNKIGLGYKIIEQPKNLIYLPITVRRLNHIEISLVDQDGAPVDLRGEIATCRIHIKKD